MNLILRFTAPLTLPTYNLAMARRCVLTLPPIQSGALKSPIRNVFYIWLSACWSGAADMLIVRILDYSWRMVELGNGHPAFRGDSLNKEQHYEPSTI
jgi:hypothetical protein